MIRDRARDDVERLSWRDIEALPYYLAALLLAFAIGHGLMDDGVQARLAGMKAVIDTGFLGIHRVFAGLS